jgi:general secretion pathway protein D
MKPFRLIVLPCLAALIAGINLPSPAQNLPATVPGPPPGLRRPQILPPGTMQRTSGRPVIGDPGVAYPATTAGAEMTSTDPAEDSALKFDGSTIEIVLKTYAEATGRTLLMDPGVASLSKATITLLSQSELTREEYLQAIETVLVMNGIALEPVGEKFMKVLPAKEMRKLGVKTEFELPAGGKHVEDGKMVSQMVSLKHITPEDARKAIEANFKGRDGQIQEFVQTGSILLTDTVDNVNRMLEILTFIDQPFINREITIFREIRFAEAEDIKAKLIAIIDESKKNQQQGKTVSESKTSGAPGILRRTLPAPVPVIPGVIRPVERPASAAEPEVSETPGGGTDADRGMIRGDVQIIADKRTNKLIIITPPENQQVFDMIIDVLDVDVKVDPEIEVAIIRLEYALAKDVAAMINDLIGNVKKDEAAKDAPASAADKSVPAKSETLIEAAARTEQAKITPAPTTTAEARMSKVGELNKDNIKILPDERINGLVIQARKSDFETLRKIIKDMDIMLSQVLIETVVLEIGLSDKLTTGIDWVQKTLIAGEGDSLTAFAGRGGGGSMAPTDAMNYTAASSFGKAAGGISYYATFFGLNVDAVIQAPATDSRTRTLASPVILTLDNKEAVIEATKDQYFFKGKRYAGTQADGQTAYEDDVEIKSVGITVKVTPRINEKGFVVMKIDEKIQALAGTQRVNEGDWPIVASRNLSAEVAVQSGQTIVLGGLVQNSTIKIRSKIPLLGDIPFVGRLFRYDSDDDTRSEVMVFLTPYVMNSPLELDRYARKRKAASDAGDMWTQGFSNSDLADPPDRKTARRLADAGVNLTATNKPAPVVILMQPQAILNDHTSLTTNSPDGDGRSSATPDTPIIYPVKPKPRGRVFPVEP